MELPHCPSEGLLTHVLLVRQMDDYEGVHTSSDDDDAELKDLENEQVCARCSHPRMQWVHPWG